MSTTLFILANLAGLLGFLYPFLLPATAAARPAAPVVFFLLTTLCLLVLIAELGARELDARTVALMGVLAAVNAALRLAENTVLVLPGGFRLSSCSSSWADIPSVRVSGSSSARCPCWPRPSSRAGSAPGCPIR